MYNNKKITLIACVDKDYAIGYKNNLLFRIPDDLKRFKKLTTGNTVIMGRNTYESIGKPLPDRQNIILTHQTDLKVPDEVYIANNIEEAVNLAEHNIFVIGGESIYRQFFEYADELLLTEVDGKVPDADAFFPEFNNNKKKKYWDLIKSEKITEWCTISYNTYIRSK